jgi:hypothetical protein
MSFDQNIVELWGLPVVDYDPKQGLKEPARKAYRVRTEYDAKPGFAELLERLLGEPQLPELQALSIGLWAPESEGSADVAAGPLFAARARLQGLRALFFGDITFEEQEVSWIEQTDLGPLVSSLSGLAECFIRGGNALRLTGLKHPGLTRLVIQTGGLSKTTIHDVLAAELPALEELELWLGSDSYGWDAGVQDFAPLLEGKLFPRLRSLGLCNSIIGDDLAEAVARAAVVSRLQVLDLSSSTLGDRGAEALLASPQVRKLSKLDLHYHYLSDAMMARFKGLGPDVDLSDRQTGEDDDRYCAVSE